MSPATSVTQLTVEGGKHFKEDGKFFEIVTDLLQAGLIDGTSRIGVKPPPTRLHSCSNAFGFFLVSTVVILVPGFEAKAIPPWFTK